MATLSHSLRAFAAVLLSTTALTGCIVEAEDIEADELAETTDDGDLGQVEQAATACTTSTTFTFSTSGGVTTAKSGKTAVAWFTAGSYTVRMTGPSRTLQPNVTSVPAVTTTDWVRTLPAPFSTSTMTQTQMSAWLNAARAVNCASGTPDVLAIGYEYIESAPREAAYALGADFHDYLGTSWDPLDGSAVSPDPTQLGDLDCSGYMRLIWGGRSNFTYNNVAASIPLSLNALTNALPRASKDQYQYGPGKIIVPFRTGTGFNGIPSSSELAALQAGDLVFFDTACDYTVTTPSCGKDWNAISHVGMYVGKDSSGNYRFTSSRSTANGPTVANTGGWSVFNNATGISGTYHKRFRAARRL